MTSPRAFGYLLLPILLSCAVSAAAPGRARADVRVWKDGDDETARYLDLTGFAQPGFIFRLGNDPNVGSTDDTFWLQRARLGFRAQLASWLTFRTEIEFSPVPTLQDAFLDVRVHRALTVRAGQFLVPFLRAFQFNELNLGFLDRPIYVPLSPDRPALRYLSPRDVGLMLRGIVGDESDRSPVFEYWAGAFVGRGANITRNDDGAFLLAARAQVHLLGRPEGVDAESDLARNRHPKVGVAVGGYMNCDDRANWNRGFTADAEFRWGGLYASGAVVWLRNGGATGDAIGEALSYDDFCKGATGEGGSPLDFVSRGAHLQAQWILPKEWALPGDHELEVLGRVDFVDPASPYDSSNPLFGGGSSAPGYVAPPRYADSDNPPTRLRLSFGVNWFPTGAQTLRVSANYFHQRELEDVVTSEGAIVGVHDDILWFQMTAGL